jgi:hypothetical protein
MFVHFLAEDRRSIFFSEVPPNHLSFYHLLSSSKQSKPIGENKGKRVVGVFFW